HRILLWRQLVKLHVLRSGKTELVAAHATTGTELRAGIIGTVHARVLWQKKNGPRLESARRLRADRSGTAPRTASEKPFASRPRKFPRTADRNEARRSSIRRCRARTRFRRCRLPRWRSCRAPRASRARATGPWHLRS